MRESVARGTIALVSNNPGKECWLPWNIYKQDNQGDFATLVMENSDYDLLTLTCDPSNDNSDPDDNDQDYIRTFFQEYGSYSGSGASIFPNLDSDGSCIYGTSNTSGVVYALGNYLNFLKNAVPAGGGTDPDPDGRLCRASPARGAVGQSLRVRCAN